MIINHLSMRSVRRAEFWRRPQQL